MYNVAAMKVDLQAAIQIAKDRVKDQFVSAFRSIYADDLVPESLSVDGLQIDRVALVKHEDLTSIYHGAGFYVVFTDRPMEDNLCRLRSGSLRAVYRGECASTRKRVMSHLFHERYKEDYETRSGSYRSLPMNQGKSFYEAFWPHCLKLEAGGPSGVNIDAEPHSGYRWLVVVHRMNGSSQEVRRLAELAFDRAFDHPAGSRDA